MLIMILGYLLPFPIPWAEIQGLDYLTLALILTLTLTLTTLTNSNPNPNPNPNLDPKSDIQGTTFCCNLLYIQVLVLVSVLGLVCDCLVLRWWLVSRLSCLGLRCFV